MDKYGSIQSGIDLVLDDFNRFLEISSELMKIFISFDVVHLNHSTYFISLDQVL